VLILGGKKEFRKTLIWSVCKSPHLHCHEDFACADSWGKRKKNLEKSRIHSLCKTPHFAYTYVCHEDFPCADSWAKEWERLIYSLCKTPRLHIHLHAMKIFHVLALGQKNGKP
jgi:hypothetical protein